MSLKIPPLNRNYSDLQPYLQKVAKIPEHDAAGASWSNLFWYLFNPRVTAVKVARKKSWSFCQKCRWQVTAKYTCTLHIYIYLRNYVHCHLEISDSPQVCHCAHADFFFLHLCTLKYKFSQRIYSA